VSSLILKRGKFALIRSVEGRGLLDNGVKSRGANHAERRSSSNFSRTSSSLRAKKPATSLIGIPF
jgi:hypothetical protein